MHDYLLSLLFGVVEGLTEFLPVSSTAHIRIAQALCHISLEDEYWKMFAVVIQLGAIMAVVVYFWGELVRFAKTFPNGRAGSTGSATRGTDARESGARDAGAQSASAATTTQPREAQKAAAPGWVRHPLTLVFIAFVVTAIPALLLKKVIDKNLESPYVMGWSLIIGGVVMGIVDALLRKPRITEIEQMGVIDAIWIGAVQILSAVFPGTSRSMCTIVAGEIFGMSRKAALEFSFFLSIPIMFAATLKELKDYVLPHADPVTHVRPPAIHLTGNQCGVLIVGTVVSFFVAWVVIAWFMHWVRKHGFVPFAVYRLLAGGAVLGMAYRGILGQ